ncbi:hypothetical protein [Mycobacterium sp. HM-7]
MTELGRLLLRPGQTRHHRRYHGQPSAHACGLWSPQYADLIVGAKETGTGCVVIVLVVFAFQVSELVLAELGW